MKIVKFEHESTIPVSSVNERTKIGVNDGVLAKDDAAMGQALLKALANFIFPIMTDELMAPGISSNASSAPSLPIAEGRTCSAKSNAAVRPDDRLTIEGKNLLVSLKQFAASLVHSSNSQQPEEKSHGNIVQLQETYRTDVIDGDDLNTVGPEISGRDQLLPAADAQATWESSGLHLIETEVDPERLKLAEKIITNARHTVFGFRPIRLLMFDQNGQGIKLVDRSEILERISSDVDSIIDRGYPYRHPLNDYAILSHTWLPKGEITYADWKNHTELDTQSPGYIKLANFCKVAAKRGLRLGWMDTVCINKENSSELDESIRSMFKWYQSSKICIAYLAETTSPEDMHKDRWFTRGWTLQELLAPYNIKFHSKNWTDLAYGFEYSDKLMQSPLLSRLSDATGLSLEELYDSTYLETVPIWRRMQWAAKRKVTREEDTAYSLMGIFNVSMPIGYGEGSAQAFVRLVREILNTEMRPRASMLEILNWNTSKNNIGSHSSRGYSPPSYLIPTHPCEYEHSFPKGYIQFYPTSSPLTLSHMGLCIPVLLMPTRSVEKHLDYNAVPKGDYSATFVEGNRVYKVLDNSLFDCYREYGENCLFVVLNIAERTNEVLLPKNGRCLATELELEGLPKGWDLPEILECNMYMSRKPHSIFNIAHHNNSPLNIPKHDLKRHGMTLRTMHL